jgi:hypothetical protein
VVLLQPFAPFADVVVERSVAVVAVVEPAVVRALLINERKWVPHAGPPQMQEDGYGESACRPLVGVGKLVAAGREPGKRGSGRARRRADRPRGSRVSDIHFFEFCALGCAGSAVVVLVLKASRLLQMPSWGRILLLCLALAGAAWFCLYVAASISANV